MKSSILIFLLFPLLFINNSFGQSLWNLEVTDNLIVCVGGDTTLPTLQAILETDSLKYDLVYGCAAELLAIYRGESEKDFILNKIKSWDNKADPDFSWFKNFEYQRIRGYLGEDAAIVGMDSVINFSNDSNLRENAIGYLARAGYFDYFDIVKSYFLNQSSTDKGILLLGEYGKDESYKNDVKILLSKVIQDSTDDLKIYLAALGISKFDSSYAVQLLDNKFKNGTGVFRRDLFRYLGLLDPNNQMERSMWVIPQESDENLRSDYIPLIYNDSTYSGPKEYLSPTWINFMENWLPNESSKLIKVPLILNIRDFKPERIDTTSSIEYNLDYLYNMIDSVTYFNWIGNINFSNKLKNITTTAKTNIQNGDSLACRSEIKSFQDTVDCVYADSLNPDPRFVTLEGWKFLHWNAQYILDRLPEQQQNPNLLVNLKNSEGAQIPASNVKYYDTSWKDAVDNGDGTFTVITTKPNVSVRMFYEYANQTVNNVPAQNNTYTFHTVNTEVELENSDGKLIDEGTVKYYAGAWRDFGTTVNGVASKELLPVNYSFRMTYEYGSNDKQQDISTNPTVIFQTVNATVELKTAQEIS